MRLDSRMRARPVAAACIALLSLGCGTVLGCGAPEADVTAVRGGVEREEVVPAEVSGREAERSFVWPPVCTNLTCRRWEARRALARGRVEGLGSDENP